jgi:CcmD family protein
MGYLLVGYTITLIGILAYVISLVRRRRQILRDADTILRAMDEREKRSR